jgi:mycothiol synthase
VPPTSPTAIAPAQFASARERAARLDNTVLANDGHPALGDSVWRDLDAAPPDSAGFFVDDVAYAHVGRSDNFAPRHWAIGLAVAPAGRAGSARRVVVKAGLDHIAHHGGGRAVCWILGADNAVDADLKALGFAPDRDLYEMRVALPLAARATWPSAFTRRTFEPGYDEPAWLEVNNRAFANHAEQGGWIEETLQRRMKEPWFDPTIFFLAFDDAGLAGFNWMKIHDERGVRLGEIFVIGVDPRTQGTGLGRALAIAGLDAVHERGVNTGSLFVAAENEGAVHLYESLGFSVHRIDRAYEREVVPA